MERYQSLYWHLVDYDLSESGVTPMTIRELLGPTADAEAFVDDPLGYPLSEGSHEARATIAAWYPEATAENVTMMNGGSEANLLTALVAARARRPARVHGPELLPGARARPDVRRERSTRSASRATASAGRSTSSRSSAPSAEHTKVVMVCNPNNPTGARPDRGRDGRRRSRWPTAWAPGSSPTRSTAAPRSTPTPRRRRSGAATTRS